MGHRVVHRRGNVGHETEIKLRIEDREAFLVRLKKIAARPVTGGPVADRTGRVHERNVLFDTAEQDLRRRGQLLRIRTESREQSNSRHGKSGPERVLLTFKRPVNGQREGNEEDVERSRRRSRHKVREEIELEIADASALRTIFEALGMRGWFWYEKYRTTFRLPESQRWARGLLIELDETPIGTFAELEGPPAAIDRAAKALGFSERDYIVMNYLSLYRVECQRRGQSPGDMVFQKGK
jgi:adenylate cyclase, class 2